MPCPHRSRTKAVRTITMRMKTPCMAATIIVIMVSTNIASTIMAHTTMVITATVSSGKI